MLFVVVLGCLVAGRRVRNVDYKHEAPEYHHDSNHGSYLTVDVPEGDENYYHDDDSGHSEGHYNYPEEIEQQEYHIEYDQKHNHHQVSHDHHGNQYEQHQQHYHQEQRDQHGQKLIKTDYDYQRKNNQVVIQNEEVKTGYDHGYQPQPQPEKKISTPSKRVHIKLPEFDYSSYTKTDSEIKYDSRPVVVDKPTSKEPRRYQKTKQQYVQKPKPQNRYEHIQRIPNDSPRSQRPRIKARIQKPSHTYRQRPQTQISLPQDDYKRLKGKYRKYHLKAYDEDKDHVLYYVDQPVQIYDPQEKKFHQFDKLSDEEAEEIQKKTSEYKGKD